ncbi:hypothetical protein MATL_G00076130 [Megalops atlanticus]|uniref:Periphilin-1 C-terminal domain-containing protein n=1 Tax=Megalops atlanticus TaxID=7932 RepID=A0A9D3T9B8_MEGAT|nr:hypothetical protein MATL_G00076130 [Megalops atlanticus]
MRASRDKERSEESDKKQKQSCDGSNKHENKVETGPPQQTRAKQRTATFMPKYGGRFFRPYYRKEDRFCRRPGFSFRWQRYHAAVGGRFHCKRYLEPSAPSTQSIQSNVKKGGNDSMRASADQEDAQRTFKSTGRKMDTGSHSAGEGGTIHGKELPLAVMQAAVRSRAIQEKRREIEEVYRQDCDTFETVVKMLIAKDPSLERSLRLSLRKNLREMGQYCVEAMEKFIVDYDSKDSSASSSHL